MSVSQRLLGAAPGVVLAVLVFLFVNRAADDTVTLLVTSILALLAALMTFRRLERRGHPGDEE